MKKKTVALLGKTLTDWGGGIDILRLFAQSLALKRETQDLDIYLLLPGNDLVTRITNIFRPYKDVLRQLAKMEKPSRSKVSPCDMDAVVEIFNKIDGITIVFFENTRRGLVACLKQVKADVVLPPMSSLGETFPIPWIGYIPDLQHKHFPDFFLKSECLKRDRVYDTLLRETKAVIVNSHAAKLDIDNFFPHAACRIFNLPFAPVPDEKWFEPPRVDVREKYRLPRRYFIISNQLWVHKSHLTAFEALALLAEKHGRNDIDIVCTGKTVDFRFPDYFETLQQNVRELGISERVHFLGHIPKIDQIHVLQGALAVIQPTLFEGGPGGGAVYDAVALGVPALVSDIPVNLEIDESNVTFFKAGSAGDLAVKMLGVLGEGPARPTREELLASGKVRAEKLGNRLLEAISSVVAND